MSTIWIAIEVPGPEWTVFRRCPSCAGSGGPVLMQSGGTELCPACEKGLVRRSFDSIEELRAHVASSD